MAQVVPPMQGGEDGGPTIAFMTGFTIADLTISQRGFVLAMRQIEESITTATTRAEVKPMVTETFPPDSLLHPELNAIPTLYRDFRAWLQAHGVAIGAHPKRRILHHIVEYLYVDEDDKKMAHDMAKMVLDKQRLGRQADLVQMGGGGPSRLVALGADHGAPTTRSLTMQLDSAYRDVSKKFSGADGKAFHEYAASYQQVKRASGASHEQKLELMYNVLHGEAKRYYDEQVEGQVATLAEVVHLISEKFNPEITQIQTRNELDLLRFNAFVKQGMSEMNALKELHKFITNNAPLLPLEYRTDRQKRDFIRHAVVGVLWAELVINRCASTGSQFQELHAELAGALQLNLEGRMTNARVDGAEEQKAVAISVQLTADSKRLTTPTHYANQGMNALPKRGFGSSVKGDGGGGANANDGKVAKGETIDGLEELYYETLMTASCSSDAEDDTGSGFEEGPSFRPGA
ncbi:hypothetical protein I4F81_002607 [Pyropia yezoensis]|uniref:Uncharacterized protein n=1 Tax=Pyropia yezoensis TaxID=2788 RepID=A0ACC3BQJ4_PYRYE|nr:hypothetical protein I4F81_002607 [Neopyropia yezoensis]